MKYPLQAHPPKSEEQSAFGIIGQAFRHQPFARKLLIAYAPLCMIGYPTLIGLADHFHRPWLDVWIRVWTPLVDALHKILPLFAYTSEELQAWGLVDRIAPVQNVLAFEWIVFAPVFAILGVLALRISHEEMVHFALAVPRERLAVGISGGPIFFAVGLWFIVCGIPVSGNDLFAWHTSNIALAVIGIDFIAVIISGIGSLIAIRGLVIARQLDQDEAGSP